MLMIRIHEQKWINKMKMAWAVRPSGFPEKHTNRPFGGTLLRVQVILPMCGCGCAVPMVWSAIRVVLKHSLLTIRYGF